MVHCLEFGIWILFRILKLGFRDCLYVLLLPWFFEAEYLIRYELHQNNRFPLLGDDHLITRLLNFPDDFSCLEPQFCDR